MSFRDLYVENGRIFKRRILQKGKRKVLFFLCAISNIAIVTVGNLLLVRGREKIGEYLRADFPVAIEEIEEGSKVSSE